MRSQLSKKSLDSIKNNLLDKNHHRNSKLKLLKAPPSFSHPFHWSRLTMTLTKDHLVSALAEANGYPRNQTVELVETLLELIKSKLSSGEDVLISGFGKFCVKEKRERRGVGDVNIMIQLNYLLDLL